jgi:hypothetical protein
MKFIAYIPLLFISKNQIVFLNCSHKGIQNRNKISLPQSRFLKFEFLENSTCIKCFCG